MSAGASRGAAILGALLAVACGRGQDDRPRNVILISIDTLRPDHLSCYGHERPTSPTLDRLAEAGARFTDVTSAAPWTLPAHATLLTGLYPSRHGVKSHQSRLPAEKVTLAEELRARGLRTLAVVNTWNVGAPQFQFDQGFDEFRYVCEQAENARYELVTLNNGEEVVALAQELLSGGDEPFFLFLHFYDVHTDFTPRPEYREMFVGPYAGRLSGRTQELIALRSLGEKLRKPDIRWLKQMYDAEIRQLDDLLGRFCAWLEQQGLAEDTLFVITSDHGEEFGEHGGTLHGRTQYQELLHIPLLLSGPGVPPGSVIDTPASGVDVAPTILGLLGFEPEAEHDGLDLSLLWRGGTLPARLFFGEADHNNRIDGEAVVDIKRMVRRGFDKLLLDRHTGQQELYDLALDPGETQDLAGAQQERVRDLRAELEHFSAGAIEPEVIPAPTAEEQRALEALGYGGEGGG